LSVVAIQALSPYLRGFSSLVEDGWFKFWDPDRKILFFKAVIVLVREEDKTMQHC